jgi:hypothetical protein
MMYMFPRFSKAARTADMAIGRAYLLNEYMQYRNLNDKMKPLRNPEGTVPSTTETKNKTWYIYGRQSPVYAEVAEHKDRLLDAIEKSPAYAKKLGECIANEGIFKFFPGVPFTVQLFSQDPIAPHVIVTDEHMVNDALDTLPDDAEFEVGFARKEGFGFADISPQAPFYHSSIGLRKVSAEEPATANSLVLTGKEVKEVFANTARAICANQHCDLYHSNCSSAAVYATAEIIKVIDTRADNNPKDTRHIQAILSVIADRAFDNFGRGVSNNSEVRTQLDEVTEIAARRGLLQTIAAKDELEEAKPLAL